MAEPDPALHLNANPYHVQRPVLQIRDPVFFTPGSGIRRGKKNMIRQNSDPGCKTFGSGINIPDPQHCQGPDWIWIQSGSTKHCICHHSIKPGERRWRRGRSRRCPPWSGWEPWPRSPADPPNLSPRTVWPTPWNKLHYWIKVLRRTARKCVNTGTRTIKKS